MGKGLMNCAFLSLFVHGETCQWSRVMVAIHGVFWEISTFSVHFSLIGDVHGRYLVNDGYRGSYLSFERIELDTRVISLFWMVVTSDILSLDG